jgi:hypothetical protein
MIPHATESGKLVRGPEITPQAAMIKAANEATKGKGEAFFKSLENRQKALRDGNKKVDSSGDVYDGYADLLYFTAKSLRAPRVMDQNKQDIPNGSGVLYSGCDVNGRIDLFCNTDVKKKGVFGGITGVQLAKEGPAFGGAAPANPDEFEDLSSGADADDMV